MLYYKTKNPVEVKCQVPDKSNTSEGKVIYTFGILMTTSYENQEYNSVRRLISELLSFVLLVLKINRKVFEARATQC